MSALLHDQVLAYFNERNNRFRNAKGMQFGLTDHKTIWTHFSLTTYKHGPLAMDISTEEDGIPEFIAGFKLSTAKNIDNLEYVNSWMRYLNSNAELHITPIELEATLTFRIVNRKTMIYSLDLHYYDEVYQHLTMAEEFEAYLQTNEGRLNTAVANRFKMNRR